MKCWCWAEYKHLSIYIWVWPRPDNWVSLGEAEQQVNTWLHSSLTSLTLLLQRSQSVPSYYLINVSLLVLAPFCQSMPEKLRAIKLQGQSQREKARWSQTALWVDWLDTGRRLVYRIFQICHDSTISIFRFEFYFQLSDRAAAKEGNIWETGEHKHFPFILSKQPAHSYKNYISNPQFRVREADTQSPDGTVSERSLQSKWGHKGLR